MHKVLVNGLGGLSLPRKSVVRLTDHPDMTLDVYRGRKTTVQQVQQITTETNNLRKAILIMCVGWFDHSVIQKRYLLVFVNSKN